MAKVFRIHNTGNISSDWFASKSIDSGLIGEIISQDKEGKKLPTSIPSPFARIDLVRRAFEVIANESIDGKSDNHQLISNALDIGQILFNYEKYSDKLDIITWDPNSNLKQLLNSNDPKHVHLGKTIELFLNQDAAQYNFDRMEKIFILRYNFEVIGGTSPRTLFFASPNADDCKVNIRINNDKVLGDQPLSLYKREGNFVKYLFALSKLPEFSKNFKEFNKYLQANLKMLKSYNAALYTDINNKELNPLDQYKKATLPNNSGVALSILGKYELYENVIDPTIIQDNCDFVIDNTKKIEGLKPLVLPIKDYTNKLRYIEAYWNSKTVVPINNPLPLKDRKLPDDETNYPYLTLGDFLTSSIIKLPYGIDSDRFYTGKLSDSQALNEEYLLPLKPAFFNYFSAKDIIERKLLNLKTIAGGAVEVSLKIPIQNGNFIEYTKSYYNVSADGIIQKDPAKGSIQELSFALSIFPFVRSQELDVDYTIGIADDFGKSNLSIELLNTESFANINSKVNNRCVNSSEGFLTSEITGKGKLDALKVTSDNLVNFILPILPEYTMGGNKFSFAIDFGTTNTHVEYRVDNVGDAKPLDVSAGDTQMVFLKDQSLTRDISVKEGEKQLMQEIFPLVFTKDSDHRTPFRTCLFENSKVDYEKETITFGNCNVGFDYEKVGISSYLTRVTDLKWSGYAHTKSKSRVTHYIEELMQICKNKVIMNGGDLSRTEMFWFYPISMTKSRLSNLRKIWENSFEKVFNGVVPKQNLKDAPESITPFYYYKKKGNIPVASKPTVSIDIGGGTSDVVIFTDNKPQLITSFRFAGNALLGDGFNGSIEHNGFVQRFKDEFRSILEKNGLTEEVKILDDLHDKYCSSTDLLNFLFSLEKNRNVKEKNLKIKFGHILSENEELKIVFLLFYAAIIYHVAQIMKSNGFDRPRNLLFSGSGSKSLQILDGNSGFDSATDLFNIIFDEIYIEDSTTKLQIEISNEPKEITAKGGLYLDKTFSSSISDFIKINIGEKGNPTIQNPFNNTSEKLTYGEVSDELQQKVLANVTHFYDVFDKIGKRLSFSQDFGISPQSMQVFKEIRNEDLIDYIKQGFGNQKEEAGDDELAVDETLFFYSFKGVINRLAYRISQMTVEVDN